jgi:hypothetical protein
MSVDAPTAINPNVHKKEEFWLEARDSKVLCNSSQLPEKHFIIGFDDVDQGIRAALAIYVVSDRFPTAAPVDLDSLSVFVFSEKPLMDKADLARFFDQPLFGYINPSLPDFVNEEVTAEKPGYVIKLEFAKGYEG